MSASELAAAPFTAYGFKFYPMRLQDWAELDAWMQDDYRTKAIKTAQKMKLDGKDRLAFFHSMHRASMLLNCSTPEGAAKLATIDGCIKVLDVSSRGAFTQDKLQAAIDESPDLEDFALSQVIEQLVTRVYLLTNSLPDEDSGPVDLESVDPTEAQAITEASTES